MSASECNDWCANVGRCQRMSTDVDHWVYLSLSKCCVYNASKCGQTFSSLFTARYRYTYTIVYNSVLFGFIHFSVPFTHTDSHSLTFFNYFTIFGNFCPFLSFLMWISFLIIADDRWSPNLSKRERNLRINENLSVKYFKSLLIKSDKIWCEKD